MELQLPLKEYGLTEKEIKIYLELLPLGTVNLQEIAKRASFPRTTVYNTLNYLGQKGLVSKITNKGITYFTATDPQKLKDSLEEKKKLINAILPDLKSLQESKKETSNVEIFEGFKGIYTIISDVFKKKQEIVYFGGYRKSLEILKHLPEHARMMRLERGIKAQIVIEPSNEDIFHTSKYKKFTEMRFLPELADFPAMIFVYGNKVALFTLNGDLVGVIIKNKEVALSVKMIFGMYWNRAKPAKL